MSSPEPTHPTPLWAIFTVRIGLLVILSFYFFIIYTISRGLIPEFGPSFSVIFRSALMTIAMSMLIVWLMLYVELPEMLFQHVLPQRRHRQGCCHGCGHMTTEGTAKYCQECGIDSTCVPKNYSIGWRAVRRFTLLLACAIMMGAGTGEFWMSSDEQRMKRITLQRTTPNFAYPPGATAVNSSGTIEFTRCWPATFSKIEWNYVKGFEPNDIFGFRDARLGPDPKSKPPTGYRKKK